MAAQAELATLPLVVDPSTALLQQAPAAAVRTRADDALAFAPSPEPSDKLAARGTGRMQNLTPGARWSQIGRLCLAAATNLRTELDDATIGRFSFV